MDIKNMLNKRAQGLPLNTIVLAILVIIVLLVIIVAFTSNITKSNKQLNEQNAANCDTSNPVLASIGVNNAESPGEGESCFDAFGDGWKPAVGIPNCCIK